MMTMSTGDDNDGDGAMGDEVDDDGDDENFGDGRRRQRWQRHYGRRHDGIQR